MARFERPQASEDRLGGTLEAATKELRAALEREAVEVIDRAREEAARIEEAAREEAARIEEAAHRRADEVEREARDRAEEAGTVRSDRIARLLEDVDAMDERMRAMVGDLRQRLSGELDDIRGPSEPHTDRFPAPPPQDQNGAGQVSSADEPGPEPDSAGTDQAMAFSRPVPLSVATEADTATERNPVLDDMMRAQIVTMAQSGTPRADAERFLGRFKLGDSYLGMLDEIYAQHDEARTAGGRSKRRRLRRRST